jgi:hypothetical protein
VLRAAKSLWASAAVAAVLTLLQLVGVIATDNIGATAVIGCLTVALLGLMAEKTRAGRGWARWLFLIIYILGSLGFIATVVLAPQVFLAQPALLQGSAVVQFALQTAALAFMFSPSSRQWFRPAHA